MNRASWLNRASFGVMVHYIPAIANRDGSLEPSWNECVNNFDVNLFCDTLARTGAKWLIMPFGQNHGEYISPNPELEKYLGAEFFTDRDLMKELALALKKRDIKLVAYLPTEVWCHDECVREALGWNIDPVDKSVFMERWYKVVECWGETFGELLSGWWFDGCYTAADKPFIPEGHNGWTNERFDKDRWFAVSRAGNPDRAVCLCPGANLMKYVWPEEDYLCGEANDLLDPPDNLPENMAPHALLWLECFWGHCPEKGKEDEFIKEIAPPRFEVDEMAAWISKFRSHGGGCTINIGIYRDGSLPALSIEFLSNLNKEISGKK
jgi:hypothetical protein